MRKELSVRKKCSGFVLLITLMLMVGLTLLAIPTIQMSNLNMKIIQNENQREELRYIVQRAIDEVINDATTDKADFGPGVVDIDIDGQMVEVRKECLFETEIQGTGFQSSEMAIKDAVWQISGTGIKNGIQISLVQGLSMQMLSMGCEFKV